MYPPGGYWPPPYPGGTRCCTSVMACSGAIGPDRRPTTLADLTAACRLPSWGQAPHDAAARHAANDGRQPPRHTHGARHAAAAAACAAAVTRCAASLPAPCQASAAFSLASGSPHLPPHVRPATVGAAGALGTPGRSTTLWVGRIASTVEAPFIQQLLEACGKLREWKPVTEPESGKLKGFGFVTYEVG